MGKRKSAKPMAGPKKKAILPTTFQCLFCNHEDSVTVKIDKKSQTGSLNCKICGQEYETVVHELSAAVDVYADWVDACDAVAGEHGNTTTTNTSERAIQRANASTSRARDSIGERDDQYEGDFVVNDETGMEEDYTAND